MSDDSNVINFPERYVSVSTNIDPRGVIEGINESDLDTVVVVGWTKEGDEYFASSTGNGMEVVWLLERLKLRILESIDS